MTPMGKPSINDVNMVNIWMVSVNLLPFRNCVNILLKIVLAVIKEKFYLSERD